MTQVIALKLWKYRIPIIMGSVILAVSFLSVLVYGYSVGFSKIFYIVGNSWIELVVGGSPPAILPSDASRLLLLLIPIEMAMLAIIILLFKARNAEGIGSGKAIGLILCVAIFGIVAFLIINNMLNVFRGG